MTTDRPMQIGMVQTLFTDVPTPVINLLMPPFRDLMKQFTGLDGQIQVDKSQIFQQELGQWSDPDSFVPA